MWNVKRDNQQDKILDFFEQSDFLRNEMYLRHKLSREKTFSWLAAHEVRLLFFLFLLFLIFICIYN